MGRKSKITRAPPLDCRDDLTGSLRHAWTMLVAGATERGAPFHLPSVATVDQEGRPQVRIVVLRHCDPERRTVRFHTDVRSSKVEQLSERPQGALVFYDKFHKIQVRLEVTLRLLQGDDLDRAWAEVHHYSRECYQVASGPGTPVASPCDIPVDVTGSHGGRDHFAAVEGEVLSLEWLYLSADYHRRARFVFDGERVDAQWILP